MDDSDFSDFLQNDDFEGDESEWASTSRDGVIFLVDCTTTMVGEKVSDDQIREDADTGVKLALLCCQNFMQNKALSSPEDMVGLVFMRTSISNSTDFKGVNIIQSLDQTDAPRILEVERLRELDSEKFVEAYGSLQAGESYPVHEALWACQNIFNKTKKALGYKRIFLITDDPDPVGNKVQLKRQAILKANDLRQSGIDIEVIPIQKADIDFQMSTFYDFLLAKESEMDSSPVEHVNTINKLLTWERSQEPNRRRLGRLPFYLIPLTPAALNKGDIGVKSTLAFGAANYCLVRRAPLPKSARIYAKTNETVVSKRRFYKVNKDGKPDLDNVIMPQDIEKGLRIGNRTLHFGQNELNGRVRQIIPMGIHLLGFKPLEKLKPWGQIKTAQFLYPEEGMAKNSTLWFTTLLSSCLRKKVFAVALYVQRQGQPPHLVALVPQEEELDESGGQITSPGFHILFLPFREDFKRLVLPKHPPAGSEEVNAAIEMVKKMSTKYYPDAIPNPTLQRYYDELEALALERTVVNEVVDHTQPDVEQIEKHAGKEIDKFMDLISQYKSGTPFASPAKKTAVSTPAPTAKELEEYVNNGTLSKLTVPVLKQCATMLHIQPASNRKADLLTAIANHFCS
ncbi:hypothetical protein Aperf_G00000034916 [Anoplocephala perfoliata]